MFCPALQKKLNVLNTEHLYTSYQTLYQQSTINKLIKLVKLYFLTIFETQLLETGLYFFLYK